MYLQTSLLQALEHERDRHKTLVCRLEQRRDCLLTGHLTYRNGSYYRIIKDHGTRKQLLISQGLADSDAIIHELQERRYITKALPLLKRNLELYELVLDQLRIYDPVHLRESLPTCYRDFDLSPVLLQGDVDPVTWNTANYAHNTGFPENLKYQSDGGLWTSSKAEADIATKLEQNHLIFRYEPALSLGSHTYYPDFEILHPQNRRLIYWEHFGKMDSPEYAHATMNKLRVYAEQGYTLGDNLIMTWETKNCPLTFAHIRDRIHTYFQ